MPTCGYICPVCSGKEIDENGLVCHWCQPDEPLEVQPQENTSSEKTE